MEADPKTLEPIPSVAESWDISEDQRVYTFRLRGNARWSNRDPVSEHDFAYSYRCMLNPDLTAQYGYILHVFNNAQLYNEGHKCDGKGVVIAAENRVYLHQFGQVKFARLRAFLMEEDPALTKLPAYSVRAKERRTAGRTSSTGAAT